MQNDINYANRGKLLEDLVALANEQYKTRGIAKVRKLPTPYQIVRRGKAMQAIPTKLSGLDYIGVCQGTAITFDCKQTKEASFPLKNIAAHQITEAREWEGHGGKAFWLIEFVRVAGIYRVSQPWLEYLIKTAADTNRKSIPLTWMVEEWRVDSHNGVALDYLAGLYEEVKAS